MPVEGQWDRNLTPLRRRDRRVLLVCACIAVAAIVGGVVFSLTRPAGPSNAGCVVVEVPSTMGGGTLRNCGSAAKTFCRTDGRDPRVAAACRRAGYAIRP
jgi:hypothetical protein